MSTVMIINEYLTSLPSIFISKSASSRKAFHVSSSSSTIAMLIAICQSSALYEDPRAVANFS